MKDKNEEDRKRPNPKKAFLDSLEQQLDPAKAAAARAKSKERRIQRRKEEAELEEVKVDVPTERNYSSVPWRNSVPLGPWTMEHIHLGQNLKADESEELTPEEKLRRHLSRNLKANE